MDNTFYRESDSDSDSEFEWDNSDEKSKKIFLNDQPQSQIKEKLYKYREKLQYNRVIIDSDDIEKNNDKLVFKNIVSFNIVKIFVSAVTTSADDDVINSIQYFDIIIPELQDCIKIKHASIDGIITRIYNNKFLLDSTTAADADPEEPNIKNYFADKVDDPTLHLNIPTTINFNTLKIFIKVKKIKYEANAQDIDSNPVFSSVDPPLNKYRIDESITKKTIQDLYKKDNIIISLQIGFYTKPP
jgi:hypothetical protein